MALSSHMGRINFADPSNIRKVHKEIITWVRTEALHISSKYKMQTESVQFQWPNFLHMLEKAFPEILNEVLSHNNQLLVNLNENKSTPNENRKQYNAGIDNKTKALTKPSPSMNILKGTQVSTNVA